MPHTEPQLEAVLQAVGYELDMLVVASELIRWSQPQPTRDPGPDPATLVAWSHNVHIEAHLVHVRNLLEFFYLDKQPIRARDYVEGGWAQLRPPFLETFELRHARVDREPATARDLWTAISTKLSHVVPDRAADLKWETTVLTRGFLKVARVFVAHQRPQFDGFLESRTHVVSWFWPMGD